MSCGVPEKSLEVRCVRPPSPPPPTIRIQVVWTLPRRHLWSPQSREAGVVPIPQSAGCGSRAPGRPGSGRGGPTRRARRHSGHHSCEGCPQLSAGLPGKAVRSGAVEGRRMGREARRADTWEEQPHGEDSAGGVAPVPESPRNRRKPEGVGEQGQLGWQARPRVPPQGGGMGRGPPGTGLPALDAPR